MNAKTWTLPHMNAKGTGTMLEMAYYPASDTSEGCLFLGLSPQLDRTFDKSEKVRFKLFPVDVAKLLQVFRGECESIEDGKGLFYRTPDKSVILSLSHVIDPFNYYRLTIRENTETKERCYSIMLSPAESLVIMCAIEHALMPMVFGR